jgi:hypothetical protein
VRVGRPFARGLTRHWPVYILLGILLLSAVLISVIALDYTYDAFSLKAGGAALAVVLAALGAAWLLTRTARREETPAALDKTTRLGLVLGLFWTVEIGANNVLAPPQPGRDTMDNIFWALIALGILIVSIVASYSSGRLRDGLAAGAWSGFVSGAVACGTALVLIVFGMRLLLSDPVNLAEWSSRAKGSTAPTMASYFAYETLAGALLHLVVSGAVMGFVLGLVGGILGKTAKLGAPQAAR